MSGHYAPARLRSNKERSVRQHLRSTGEAASDQCQVWADVGETLCGARAESCTMAMSDAYASMESRLREAASSLHPPDDTCGLAAFVRQELAVIDLFGYRATFRQVRPKLVDSYLMAAMAELRFEDDGAARPTATDFRKLTAEALERAAAGRSEARRTAGLGTDVRLTAENVRGAALVFDGTVLHASLFPSDGDEGLDNPAPAGRMASPRRRRNKGAAGDGGA
jgi:hypothetical protein